jgi:hypothetical protein
VNYLNEQNLPGLLVCMAAPDVNCTAAHTKSNNGLQKMKEEACCYHHHYYTLPPHQPNKIHNIAPVDMYNTCMHYSPDIYQKQIIAVLEQTVVLVVVVVVVGGGGGGDRSNSQCVGDGDGTVLVMMVVMITTVTTQKGLYKITSLFLAFIISFNAK